MSFRLAESLITLREQANTIFPNRSKASDGWIGNAEHATRASDHNPFIRDGKVGVVYRYQGDEEPRVVRYRKKTTATISVRNESSVEPDEVDADE